jgi:ABC-2 type transport system permease protein
MLVYLRLEVLRMFRDRRFTFFSLAVPVVFYLLFSSVNSGSGKDSATGLSVQVYLMVSMAAYGAIGAALTTTGHRLATERQNGWLRQLQITPMPAWMVIATKALASMILALPAICLVSLVAATVKGVHLSPAQWLGMIALMWLATLPFAALGTLIGSTVNPETAQPVTLAAYFTLSIIGGLWMPVSQLPKALRTVSDWTPSNRFAEIGRSIVAGHSPSVTAGLILVGWTVALGALAVTAYSRTTVKAS